MGAYRTKTITYTPTDDDCGTSITFSATATDRPDRTIDALIAKVEFKSLKVIGKKNLVVGNDFGVDAKFESAVTITPTIPKAKVTDIFKFRLFQGVGSGYNRVRKTPPASWDTKHDYEGASDIAIIPNDDGTVQVNGTDDPFTQVLELTNPAISATTDFTANLYLQYKCGDSWKALGKVQWKWIGSWKNDGTTTGGVDTVEGAAFSGDVSLPPIPPKP